MSSSAKLNKSCPMGTKQLMDFFLIHTNTQTQDKYKFSSHV